MRSPLPFSTLLLLVAACSGRTTSTEVAQRLEEGRLASPNELNATASFVSGSQICTAAVVAPDIAVTAAHCLVERVGLLCIERGTVADCTVVDAIVPHAFPEPECPKPSDLAVLHLRRPLPDLAYFSPSDTVATGDVCTVVGYGKHHDERTGELDIVTRRVAKMRVEEVREHAFRAIGIDGYTTDGDSGGPVICNGKLVGLTSCGDDGSRDGWYSRLELPWLTQTIADLQELSKCGTQTKFRCDHYGDRDDLMKCGSDGKWALDKFCIQGSCTTSQQDARGTCVPL